MNFMNLMKLWIVFLSFELLACNNSFGQRAKNNPSTGNSAIENSHVKLPTDNIGEDLLLYPEIEAILAENPCIAESDCATVVVEAGKAEIKENQIMILEELHIPPSTFSRYEDRVSGFYDRDEDGKFKRIHPIAQVSKPILEIMGILNQNRKAISKSIPSLGAYLAVHNQFEFISGEINSLDHAATVFELLVDKNPDTNFVMANIPELSPEERCALVENDQSLILKTISDKFDNAAQSLIEIIKTHNIKTINVSYLSTIQSELQHMKRDCKNQSYSVARQIIQIKNNFFLNLLNNSDVVIVQAVPNDDHQLYHCPFHRRWIRVGYVNIPNSSIPDEGVPLTDEFLPRNLLPVSTCITVAINSGIIDKQKFEDQFPAYYDEHSLFRNYGGLYAYPIDLMATSWATPLALSMIRLKTQSSSPDLVYTSIINRILDPIKNQQFIQND